MKVKRMMGLALVGALSAAGLVATSGSADAVIGDTDPLISCNGGAGTIGTAKVAPGLTIVEKKQSISATFNLSGCAADEADLDEIAAESKFGVTKTAAGGRAAITGGIAKAKFTTYGDCLGLFLPNDPDETGEYPATHGTVSIQWTGAAGAKPAKTDAFATLVAGLAADINGIVIKGAGVGGTLTATAGFGPSANDDKNGNTQPDLVECAVAAEPTAVGINIDIIGPAEISVTL